MHIRSLPAIAFASLRLLLALCLLVLAAGVDAAGAHFSNTLTTLNPFNFPAASAPILQRASSSSSSHVTPPAAAPAGVIASVFTLAPNASYSKSDCPSLNPKP